MKKYLAVFIVRVIGFKDRENYFFQCKEQDLKKKIEKKRDEFEKQWKIRLGYKLQSKSVKVELFKLYELIEITPKDF